MASPKSLATALTAAGLVSVLGYAYAQSGYDQERANDRFISVEQLQKEQNELYAQQQAAAQQQPSDLSQQQPQAMETPAMPAAEPQAQTQVDSPAPSDSPPATAQPQYNDSAASPAPEPQAQIQQQQPAPPKPIVERAPRADRN